MQKYLKISRKCFSTSSEFIPHSTVTIFKRSKPKIKECIQDIQVFKSSSPEYRENAVKIQMLSSNLYKQVFGNVTENTNEDLLDRAKSDFRKHGIKLGDSPKLEDVVLKIPKLKGNNIEEHFYTIAKEQSEPYSLLIDSLVSMNFPKPPGKWTFKPGWVVYKGGKWEAIDFPQEDALVFDVETCVSFGPEPILATAVGKNW